MYGIVEGVKVYGTPDMGAVAQLKTCIASSDDTVGGALMGDHHLGYSMPVGGVIAHRQKVPVSGVGFDIACGNKAAMTNLTIDQLKARDIKRIADEIFARISFGMGRNNDEKVEHELFDDPAWSLIPETLRDRLKKKAENQLGTVGGGNHYVDVFADEAGTVWIGNHFGSRGLGHTIATAFLNLAHGFGWEEKGYKEGLNVPPTFVTMGTSLGDDYWALMNLAGRYAYAGRDWVVARVAEILGAQLVDEVHNHHNFAWLEEHGGEKIYVTRKGATPCFPGQRGFIGGSMGDVSVIVEGKDSAEAEDIFRSTVHGAGRKHGRNAAAGKMKWVPRQVEKFDRDGKPTGEFRTKKVPVRDRSTALFTVEQMMEKVRDMGVELRGADVDESPMCYKNLREVLADHGNTLRVTHVLRPVIVAMAGPEVHDEYKD